MRPITLKIYFYLVFICLSINYAHAESYNFKGITKSDGLSDLLVNVIYKDAVGYIWLGTGKGLDRFDGIRIKHYPFEHNLEEQRIRINAICETSDSNIWVGNANGLWYLDKLTGNLKQQFEQEVDSSVNALFYDGSKYLYIGTTKGLFKTDFVSIDQIYINDNPFSFSNDIRGITHDHNGIVWVITANGLISYNPVNHEIKEYEYADQAGKTASLRTITFLNHILYIGTYDKGIISFDTNTKKFSEFLYLGASIISSISTDGDDILYVSTDGNGVFFISQSENRIIKTLRHNPNQSEGIRSNSIYSLLVDDMDRIWIGFYQDGFDYSLYQSDLFKTYKYNSSFDSSNLTVRSFVIKDNQKLIGTRDGLYFVDEEKNIVKKFDRSVLQSDLILSLTFYDNEYYVGTYDAGLYVLNPRTLEIHRMEDELKYLYDGHIFCFKRDDQNNLWIGTSKGLVLYNSSTERLERFTSANSLLPEGNVYEIFFDSSGKGWICCEKGMALIDPNTKLIRTDMFPDDFFHKEKIRMVYEDTDNNLYFLPEKGNLYKSDLNMKSFFEIIQPIFKHINV